MLLTAARVEVLAHAALPECAGQGGGGGAVPVSGAYTVELPPATRGEVARVTRPLHQQVAPDGADRITLHFAALLGGADLSESALYQLRVQIVTSERRPLDVGRFLIAAPGAIERSGATLPESDALLTGPTVNDRLPLTWTWCYRRNLTELRRMMGCPAVAPATWPRSPASSGGELAQRDGPHARARGGGAHAWRPRLNPLEAVFAAASTHAPVTHSVRMQAAARLLESAQRALAAGGISPAIATRERRSSCSPRPRRRRRSPTRCGCGTVRPPAAVTRRSRSN